MQEAAGRDQRAGQTRLLMQGSLQAAVRSNDALSCSTAVTGSVTCQVRAAAELQYAMLLSFMGCFRCAHQQAGAFFGTGGPTCSAALEGALVEVVAHPQHGLQQVHQALAGVDFPARPPQHLQLLPHLQIPRCHVAGSKIRPALSTHKSGQPAAGHHEAPVGGSPSQPCQGLGHLLPGAHSQGHAANNSQAGSLKALLLPHNTGWQSKTWCLGIAPRQVCSMAAHMPRP